MKKPKITYKQITTILFSVIVFGFFITVGERFVRSSVLHHHFTDEVKTETEHEEGNGKEFTDWSKIYPIDWEVENEEKASEKSEEENKTKESGKLESLADFIDDTVKYYETGVNYYTNNLLFMRMNFVELNAKFNKIIGMKLISGSDNVLYMADGNLTYYPSNQDVTKSAENIADFAEYSNKLGSKFLYVQAPSKVDPDNNYLPSGVTDYDNIKADKIIETLNKRNVNNLDLRQSMKQFGMNFTTAFYRTDHHWKAQTGMWATQQIAEKAAVLGMPYNKDKLDLKNYDEQVFKNYMFGSLGKKVSLAYTDPEDISIFTPKFETDYYVNYYDFRILEGSFKDTMINMSVFDKIDYYRTSTYGAYFYGVSAISSIENRMADNDYRILFIGDSFSNSVVPFLSTQVKYLDRIDSRYYNGGIKSYVEKIKPDLVIVMYYPGSLGISSQSYMHFR